YSVLDCGVDSGPVQPVDVEAQVAMAKKLQPDRILFLITLMLVGLGVAMVFSSSAIVAKEKFGDPNFFSFKQLIFAALGLAVMFVVMKLDYHVYRHPA